MTNDKSLDPHIMSQFTGSGHWYRFGLDPRITCTDGAKYVADTAGAYWLLDEIALAQRYDNVVLTKAIPFTDFPKEGVALWFANDVIYLPSEH